MKILGFLVLAVVACSVHGKKHDKGRNVVIPGLLAKKIPKEDALVGEAGFNRHLTKGPEGIHSGKNGTSGRASGLIKHNIVGAGRRAMLGKLHYPAPREHCRSQFGDPPPCKPTIRKVRDFYTKKQVPVTINNYAMCLKKGDYGFGPIYWACGSQSLESKLFSRSWNHGLNPSKHKK